MAYDHKTQQILNEEAVANPQPGDYWHEMLCPYFLVVKVQGDQYTILPAINYDGIPSARIAVDKDHWGFDYSKSAVVSREWINKHVRYSVIDGFVADVVRGEKQQAFVNEWIEHRGRQLVQELKQLGPELSRKLLMEEWQ